MRTLVMTVVFGALLLAPLSASARHKRAHASHKTSHAQKRSRTRALPSRASRLKEAIPTATAGEDFALARPAESGSAAAAQPAAPLPADLAEAHRVQAVRPNLASEQASQAVDGETPGKRHR